MALHLGDLTAYLKTDNKQLKQGLAEAKRDVKAAGRDMEHDSDATGKAIALSLGQGFRAGNDRMWRDAAGRLRDARGRFAAAGEELGRAAGQGAASGLSTLTGALAGLGSGAVSLGSNFWLLIPALLALAVAAAFVTPIVYALGGALGSLPALAAGGGAAIATLVIGFGGLADAFRKTSSAGSSVADRAYQVARAERGVRDANREVLDSQLALNRARMQAAEGLQDLNRNLASARLDEESAVLAVTEAERDLAAARRGGNGLEIRRAELALRQAKQSVLDVQDRVEDLAAEQAEASRKGVEGSDEVTSALRRQERAVEGVQDAEHALAQARRGSGGGAAGEVTKLAASAAGLVAVLKGLKPAWEDLRLSVQQRLFAGIGGEVQLLADSWLPRLKTSLGRYADTFNGIFKTFSESARDPKFMDDMGVGLESTRGLIDKVGSAIAGPGVKAFGQLSRAAKPFIDMLGDKFAGAIESFSKWIDDADKSGKLTTFFEKAAGYLSDIWDIGGDVFGLVGDFFSIWSDTDNADSADDLFGTIKTGLADLREWLSDPENREHIRQFVDGFLALGSVIMEVVGWLVETGIPAASRFLDALSDAFDWVMAAADTAATWIISRWDALVGWVKGLPARITAAAAGMWNGLKDSFKAALNWIIARWNGLSFTLPSTTILGQKIGGGTLKTPHIEPLDVGGRILASGLAVVHQDEVVVPAAQVRRLERGEPAISTGGVGGGTQTLEIRISTDYGVRETRKTVRIQGGRTDRVLVGR
jgi:hypothetical protein